MIERTLTDRLQYFAQKFPVLTLTGPRQSGKSTLLCNCFPEYKYVSLEEPDIRLIAESDPRGFLDNFNGKLIIDEVQYVPDLLSYIQTKVDRENIPGMYILSGSQNFLLMQRITQSLAGRAAILKLLPFSYAELTIAGLAPVMLDDVIFTGGYPRIYDKQIKPDEFYPHYIQTYVERDVRLLRNISDLSGFIRFLKLCAGRIGQLLNVSALANESGINVATVQAWLSVLETSYVIFLLKPYYRNFNKRLTKSSKLYFYDTGLACSLLSVENPESLYTHYLRGGLFENWIIAEYIKQFYAMAKEPSLYFWRDSNGNEIDLLVENGERLQAFEIKSASTMNTSYFKGLSYWRQLSNASAQSCHVIYGGDRPFKTDKGDYIPWNQFYNFGWK